MPVTLLAGSNLRFGDYPRHSCVMPKPPPEPYWLKGNHWKVSGGELRLHNQAVESYNDKVEAYNQCITGYVDNANADIEMIRRKAEEAIFDAENNSINTGAGE